MIININGWPGIGKLTIARHLQKNLSGRLLDNHSIFNVASSLCEFQSEEFFHTVRAVRNVAWSAALAVPCSVPIILTSAYADTPFGRENWSAIRELAYSRGSELCNVVLDCGEFENVRRLQSPERAKLRKLIDPDILRNSRAAASLLTDGGDHLLRISIDEMRPEDVANQIAVWLGQVPR